MVAEGIGPLPQAKCQTLAVLSLQQPLPINLQNVLAKHPSPHGTLEFGQGGLDEPFVAIRPHGNTVQNPVAILEGYTAPIGNLVAARDGERTVAAVVSNHISVRGAHGQVGALRPHALVECPGL